MKARPWTLVALLSATATASYLCRVNLSVTGVLLMREFNLTQAAMGEVFSAFVLGYALTQIPGGMLADRWGARRVLIAAAIGWTVMTVLTSTVGLGPLRGSPAATVAILLALRFVLGITEAPTFPAAAQGVSRWMPAEAQGRANGIVLAAIGIGSAIAPPFVSTMMVRWGWRVALVVSTIPAIVVAALWLAIEPPRVTTDHEPAPIDRDEVVRPRARRSFVLLTISYTLQGYVGYIFVFWFYLYLVQERHFDLLRGGVLASLPWLMSLISIPIGGLISDRLVVSGLGAVWGRRVVPIVGLCGAAAGTAVGARTADPYLAAAALAIATACVLSVEGPFWATMIELRGASAGTAGGVMNMGSNIGGFLSPTLTPLLAARIGWANALNAAAAVAFVAAVLWIGISPEAARRADARVT